MYKKYITKQKRKQEKKKKIVESVNSKNPTRQPKRVFCPNIFSLVFSAIWEEHILAGTIPGLIIFFSSLSSQLKHPLKALSPHFSPYFYFYFYFFPIPLPTKQTLRNSRTLKQCKQFTQKYYNHLQIKFSSPEI